MPPGRFSGACVAETETSHPALGAEPHGCATLASGRCRALTGGNRMAQRACGWYRENSTGRVGRFRRASRVYYREPWDARPCT